MTGRTTRSAAHLNFRGSGHDGSELISFFWFFGFGRSLGQRDRLKSFNFMQASSAAFAQSQDNVSIVCCFDIGYGAIYKAFFKVGGSCIA